MAQARVWLITGASTGLGRQLTETVLRNGDIVVAGVRKPQTLSDLLAQHALERFVVLEMDVTKKEDVSRAFATIESTFGRLDVVVNNAGVGILSEVEGTPDDVARHLFEVNFWGALYISREAVRAFREMNPKGAGGRIIQISSQTSISAAAGCSFYSASKSALNGITEALRKELDPGWNIKISIVLLGTYKTPVRANSTNIPVHPAYTDPNLPTSRLREVWKSGYEKGDPAKASNALWDLSIHPQPPFYLALGKDAVALVRKKAEELEDELDTYEPWSNDLTLD